MLGLGNSIGGYVGSGINLPSDLSGLTAWYRYQYGYRNNAGALKDATTTYVSDDTNLGGWDDAVGSNDLVQTTSGDQPRFVAADQSLNFKNNAKFFDLTTQIDITGDYTITVVALFTGSLTNRTFFGGDANNDGTADDVIKLVNSTKINFQYGASAISVDGSTTLAADAYYVFTFTRSGDVTTVYVDGTSWGTVSETAATLSIDHVGAQDPEAQNFRGQWKDVAYYNRALTTGEISDLNAYLSTIA